jgi:phosphohistidine phosphatase
MLFLVHHAAAVDALVDPQRPLTEPGHQQAKRLADRARERGVKPDVIWHSGKLRARQTAEYFWRACNPLAEFSAARNLQPDDPPRWAADVLMADDRTIMLVGHMPHMARLLEVLTARPGPAASFPLHGLVALERRDAEWVETWRAG